MKLSLVVPCLVSAAIALSGCAGAVNAPPKSAKADTSEVLPDNSDEETQELSADPAKPEPTAAELRFHVGDYFVQRFSGSFSKQPLTLTEKVIAHEDGMFVVDYELEQAGQMSRLRARYHDQDARLMSVHRLDVSENEVSVERGELEKLLARTAFTPDENVRELDSQDSTCLVGEQTFDCVKTSYEVRVGDAVATLEIHTSAEVTGRDLGGEVMTPDGKLLYRAELVEAGNDADAAALSQR